MTKMSPATRAEWYATLTPEELAAWQAKAREMGERGIKEVAIVLRQVSDAFGRAGRAAADATATLDRSLRQ